MRHSLEPEYRKYAKGYGFLSFARKFCDKYGKRLVEQQQTLVKLLLKLLVKK